MQILVEFSFHIQLDTGLRRQRPQTSQPAKQRADHGPQPALQFLIHFSNVNETALAVQRLWLMTPRFCPIRWTRERFGKEKRSCPTAKVDAGKNDG
jgi:hypothetical protein